MATAVRSTLTPKQQRFIHEYLIDLNATQAAIRAGYSEKMAGKIGSQLLGKTRIAAAVAEKQAKLAAKSDLTAQKVIDEMAKIGFANMADYVTIGSNGEPFVDLSKLTREQAAAIGEVTVEDFVDGRGENARDVRRVKFKLHEKLNALVNLGKHLGMFTDRVEHTGKNGAAIDLKVTATLTPDDAYLRMVRGL